MKPPRCFISYSWDSDKHREWVRQLATRMRECGVDAILDQFHCAPGMDLTKFMEKSVRESSYVLLICTQTFAEKADAGVGGVGYEKAIVTGEMFAGEVRETKFVPVLREGDAKESLPSYLKSRLFVDFRDDDFFEDRLEELLRHFHGKPACRVPPIGPSPWNDEEPRQKEKVLTKVERVEHKQTSKFHPFLERAVANGIKSRNIKRLIPSKTMQDWNRRRIFAPVQEPALKKKTENSIGMEFILIPAGSFMMGSGISHDEVARLYGGEAKEYKREHPQHDVKIIKPFYMQTTQVTQGQWQNIMGSNPSRFRKWLKKTDRCPVENVSWDDTKSFIGKINDMESNDKYRLPTEAEWEYACRANTTTEFSFGNKASKLVDNAWYADNSNGQTHPVASKNANHWGLYDMHGNVREWVEDDRRKDYTSAPCDGSAWINKPRSTRTLRVTRGGGWNNEARYCRSAYRNFYPRDSRYDRLGFRIAISIAS